MPSSHLILCCPLLLLPLIPPSIRVFPNKSTLSKHPGALESLSTDITITPGGNSGTSLRLRQAIVWARNRSSGKDVRVWRTISRPLPGYSFFSHSCQKCQELVHGCTTLELKGSTLNETKWCHFYVFSPYAFTFYFSDEPDTYVGLLLMTPKILSLPFDLQDNAFLSWTHSNAALHNWYNCWVCRALPFSSVVGFTWCVSPLQGKVFLQFGEYFHQQQSYVIPLLNLMTSNNPKMDWCNS